VSQAPDPPPADAVTRLLREAGAGNREAAEALLALVYDELRAIARRRMAGEKPGHTLQATALVHEAFLKMTRAEGGGGYSDRRHFYRTAAEAMRRILIDHARGKERVKRGGGASRVLGSVVDLAVEPDPDEILSVDEALCRLEERDPRLAEVVKLRFYAGLSEQETAAALGVTDRTVRRDWVLARSFLARELDLEG
jgi:RNA polymerase sigma-70 factor (ECF subfamily)